jgi:hypothetical protein
MVLETLVCFSFNSLTRLVDCNIFIITGGFEIKEFKMEVTYGIDKKFIQNYSPEIEMK